MAEPTILLDGALGTELSRRGFVVEAPLFSARALIEAPALLTAIHLDYLRAGAQVLSTNSFGLHAQDLVRAGIGEHQRELAQRSVELVEATRRELRPDERGLARFRIAGSIPPLTSAGTEPAVERAEYRALADALVDAGVDLILLETFSGVAAARLALEALVDLPVPVWLAVVAGVPPSERVAGVSHRPDGTRLLAGDDFSSLLAMVTEPGLRRPDALLINCTQIDAVPAALDSLLAASASADWQGPLGFYPHLGKRRHDGVWIDRIVEPEVFAEQMAAWMRTRPRLSLAGACCGSEPADIAAMGRCLQADAAAREAAWMALAALVP